MQTTATELTELAVAILLAEKVPQRHAEIQADLLVEAELRGRSSHGVLRLPRIVERIRNGVCNPLTTGRREWRGHSFLAVDGEMGLGPVVATAALDEICARARTSGIALAAIANNNHLGMLAWYAEHVVARGQVLLALTTSEALVHPFGGRRAMIGTNPIAIGVPASPSPFILDMATSIVSMGEIHNRAHRKEPIPGNWALDADGNPTTDAEAAKGGAIAPFGGAKGYALALGFEVLVAALTRSALGTDVKGTLDSVSPCNKGDVFIVCDGRDESIVAPISAYLEAIRTSAPGEGFSSVAIPGDRSQQERARRMKEGFAVADEVWSILQKLRNA